MPRPNLTKALVMDLESRGPAPLLLASFPFTGGPSRDLRPRKSESRGCWYKNPSLTRLQVAKAISLIASLQAIQSELRCRADHHCEVPSVPQIVEPAKAAPVMPTENDSNTLKEIYSPWVKSTQSSLPAPKKAAPR